MVHKQSVKKLRTNFIVSQNSNLTFLCSKMGGKKEERKIIVWFMSVQRGWASVDECNFNKYLMPQSPLDTMSYLLNPNLGSIEHCVPAVW
jgi:hypothetical protein